MDEISSTVLLLVQRLSHRPCNQSSRRQPHDRPASLVEAAIVRTSKAMLSPERPRPPPVRPATNKEIRPTEVKSLKRRHSQCFNTHAAALLFFSGCGCAGQKYSMNYVYSIILVRSHSTRKKTRFEIPTANSIQPSIVNSADNVRQHA